VTTPHDAVMVDGPAGPLGVFAAGPSEGDDGLPSLLLLHGIQGTAGAWEAVMQALPPAGPVLAPDLRGRRRSACPHDPQAYAMERFADDLAAVIRWHGRPVIIAGWSMGVLVALTYIRDYGLEGVSGLALIGGTACPGGECPWFHGSDVAAISREAEARAQAMGLREYAAPVAVAGAWLSARRADLRPMLGSVAVPALILHGERDEQCPLTHARVLAEGIRGAELEVLPGLGHGLPSEAPAHLARRLHALRECCSSG